MLEVRNLTKRYYGVTAVSHVASFHVRVCRGRGNLKAWWPVYLAAFVAYTSGFSSIERMAFALPRGAAVLALALAVTLAAAIALRHVRRPRLRALEVEEEAEAPRALGLSG
ncbi:MAG: hypothetical protein HYU53_02850 [Acidobacteria bacterium]|nr:hypothetical protein [Acidobacteriota bacterium]